MNRRSFPFRLGALVCGALVLSLSFQAAAQTQASVATATSTSEAEAVDEARRLFNEAIELTRQPSPRWLTALELFHRACALLPTDAVCRRWLVRGHFERADWITAGRELQEYYARLSGAPSVEILQMEPTIYQHVGRLRVRLAAGEMPDGVTVYLDGDAVPAIHFQNDRLRLIVTPGRHTLEARAPGHDPTPPQNVVVAAGEDLPVILLTPVERRGTLRILPEGDAEHNGFTITIDGRPVSTSHYDNPEDGLQVAPGDHMIEAHGSCRESTSVRINVTAGQNLLVSVPIHERRCVYHRWWFWTAVSVGVLAIGGAVATGVYLSSRPTPDISTSAIVVRGP